MSISDMSHSYSGDRHDVQESTGQDKEATVTYITVLSFQSIRDSDCVR
jgi:hypothetical protein